MSDEDKYIIKDIIHDTDFYKGVFFTMSGSASIIYLITGKMPILKRASTILGSSTILGGGYASICMGNKYYNYKFIYTYAYKYVQCTLM